MDKFKLNGASIHFPNPILDLQPTTPTAIMLAKLDKLIEQHKDGRIKIDAFRAGLRHQTDTAVSFSKLITNPNERKAILPAFVAAWESTYDGKYLEQQMHENAGDNLFASLIAAYGNVSKVSDATKSVMIAALVLDKKHGFLVPIAATAR